MKDLYKRLNLSGSGASESQIRDALAHNQALPEDLRDASQILLNPARRAAYDRTHRTLTTIGKLRARIELNDMEHWQQSDYNDFTYSSLREWRRAGAGQNVVRRLPRALYRAVVFVALVGFIYWIVSEDNPPSRDVARHVKEKGSVSIGRETPPATNTIKALHERAASDKTPLNTSRLCELQELLANLGQYRGAVDGIVGPGTRGAVQTYQATHSLPETGTPALGLLEHVRVTHRSRTPGTDVTPDVSLPLNGHVFVTSEGDYIAPLEVVTPPGSYHFYVKVQNVRTGGVAKTFFVRAGSSVTTEVPPGQYQIKYASGQRWFGPPCLFGRNTIYSQADKLFDFYRTGYQVTGYSIELILQVGGNLRTRRIAAADF